MLAFRRLLCYNIFRCKTIRFARLAQLAEHLTLNQGVQGSNPWRRIESPRLAVWSVG